MATILVIDDQEPIRALLRVALEDAGHEVREASHGRQGLALYRERSGEGALNVATLLGARQTFQKPLDMEQLLSAVRYELAH